MPRVNNIMQLPPNTYGVPGRPIESAKYNTAMDDLVADANSIRPVSVGGTGGNTPETARAALGVGVPVQKTGDAMTGALTSAVKAHGTLAAVTEEFKYADGNTHTVTCNGALTINPTGLVEGGPLKIGLLYQSGTVTVSGTTQWELGGGDKSTALADLGIILTAGRVYRIVFEVVAGVRTGIFQ